MRMKKLLSLFLALVMVLSLVPTTVFATEPEYVYISASHEGEFITDSNGKAIAYRAVSLDELATIDLDTYGLGDYVYDKDGDGSYEITALHLYIYTHEVICGLDWNEVTVTGGAGSIYFAGGLFGFEDENLRYNYNGAYPADENGWGFTADQIVLSEGDYFDVAHYTDWMFYADSAYGFHYFTNENDEIGISYEAEAGTDLTLKLIRVGGGMGAGDTQTNIGGYTVSYGQTVGAATGSVTTEDDGTFKVNFPTAGTWYVWCNGDYGVDMASGIVSSPASATVTVTAVEAPEQSRQPQDVSTVLNATMAKMATTVTAPAFGTNAGEWTVLSLARGEYYDKDNVYFTDYYNRIVETVNTTAASVNMNGALHKNKSTDNSRLIVALSSIGKDATAVGDWNLVEAYSANGFDWIKKQGINGTIWALIALDSHNYATSDITIRQQCVDSILSLQHDDGGWSLMANKTYASDPDVTGMALTALYPYRNQTAVAAAAEEAFACLSAMQHDNGTFASGGSECSESCAWVIVATTMWGINPDTDSRFVKNGKSVVDGLLSHYLSDSATFEHIVGAGANGMATDQSCYALVAYDRFINGEKALFDYSDVTFEEKPTVEIDKPKAYLHMPAEITNDVGTTFTATVTIDQWDNEAGYKLLDMVMSVPEGITVKETETITANRLGGGSFNYNIEAIEKGSDKLRVVYFDTATNTDITIKENTTGNKDFPADMFTIEFMVDELLEAGTKLNFAIDGMSLKKTSDSGDENAMVVVDTTKAKAEVVMVEGVSFSAVCLYTGDDVDLIPKTQKAVAVFVTGLKEPAELRYDDGTNEYNLIYSEEMKKGDIHTYVALVDASIDMKNFVDEENYELDKKKSPADTITFGDADDNDVINAQDALAAVNAWLRKGDTPDGKAILVLNVNGDSRINTFDALGIMEKFVDDSKTHGVVTNALTAEAVTDNNTETKN